MYFPLYGEWKYLMGTKMIVSVSVFSENNIGDNRNINYGAIVCKSAPIVIMSVWQHHRSDHKNDMWVIYLSNGPVVAESQQCASVFPVLGYEEASCAVLAFDGYFWRTQCWILKRKIKAHTALN